MRHITTMMFFDKIDIKIDIDLSLHVRLTSEKLNSAQVKWMTVKVLFLLELHSRDLYDLS